MDYEHRPRVLLRSSREHLGTEGLGGSSFRGMSEHTNDDAALILEDVEPQCRKLGRERSVLRRRSQTRGARARHSRRCQELPGRFERVAARGNGGLCFAERIVVDRQTTEAVQSYESRSRLRGRGSRGRGLRRRRRLEQELRGGAQHAGLEACRVESAHPAGLRGGTGGTLECAAYRLVEGVDAQLKCSDVGGHALILRIECGKPCPFGLGLRFATLTALLGTHSASLCDEHLEGGLGMLTEELCTREVPRCERAVGLADKGIRVGPGDWRNERRVACGRRRGELIDGPQHIGRRD